MNKNSLLGFVLIGAILIGFSWYNARLAQNEELLKAEEDSLKITQLQESSTPEKLSKELQESYLEQHSTTSTESSVELQSQLYSSESLASASRAEESFTRLENSKIAVEFSNIGAKPISVVIKDYSRFDGKELKLFGEEGVNFNLQLFAGQTISTSYFGFQLISSSDSELLYRLNIDSLSYIQYSYRLLPDSYLVDMDVTLVGMDRYTPRNQTAVDLEWEVDMARQERGYANEKNYSTVVYNYPNSTSVNNLGLRKESSSANLKVKVNWVAFQQQFFSAILIAKEHFNYGDLAFHFYPEGDANLMHCSAKMNLNHSGGESANIPLQFYFGPNHFKTLKSYNQNFEKIVPLGGSLIGWINRYIIINVFDLLSRFINSYGLIILLLTLLIKLVISPLTIKSYISSAKMRVLKPEIDKINAKYPKKDDAMKKQQETMALYNKAGVSMFGGCLPMLLQFPILFAMFRFFPASFELRQEGFLWVKDLSTYDSILDLPFSIPLYGSHVSLLAILMALSMFFYSRMNAQQMEGNPQMAGMKFMSLYFMPLFLLFLGNNFSSGLCYYYFLSNLITMIQTWAIRRFVVDEEEIIKQLKSKSVAPKKRSKFQERLDAAYKAQQEQLKQRK
ncbi:MAG: membrane protein insertase YidC [Bacteroidales bacterium]